VHINELVEDCRRFDKEKGFDTHPLEQIMVAFIGEVGEFANILRHIQRGDKDERTRAHLEEEWTDMLIFVLDLAARLGIDAEKNYLAKARYNESRFHPVEVKSLVEDWQALENLREDWSRCAACTLCANRKCTVYDCLADLSVQSGVMFVGEGPGKSEQEEGVPFVGPAGKILDSVLLELGLSRKNVYVSNIVKCRAQEGEKDRPPTKEESEACIQWLKREIDILKPKVIIPLGQTALNNLTDSVAAGISSLAGKEYLGGASITFGMEKTMIVPLVHPAACLYGFDKKKYLEHIVSLRRILEEKISLAKPEKSV